MMRGCVTTLVFATALASVPAGQSSLGLDWPQWRCPDRNGVSQESGLMKQWPASGPPHVWSISNLGAGYGSISIKGDRIFVQGSNERQSIVFSLNRADGKGVWSKALGPAVWSDRGPGPRGTPTIDDDRLYLLSEDNASGWPRPVRPGTRSWAGSRSRINGRRAGRIRL